LFSNRKQFVAYIAANQWKRGAVCQSAIVSKKALNIVGFSAEGVELIKIPG